MRTLPIIALLLCAPLAAPLTTAGIDIDLGAQVRVGDDSDVFLSISARYFDVDRGRVDSVSRRFRNPDDVAVALFIAHRSDFGAERVLKLRDRGLSWWEISVRAGVPASAWFVPVERNPGPPYGKAYGHWKNHKQNQASRFALNDADARNLVAVRMLHEYYGVSVGIAMDLRASGGNLRELVSSEYHKRHGKSARQGRDNAPGRGHGKDHGKSRGKGHR